MLVSASRGAGVTGVASTSNLPGIRSSSLPVDASLAGGLRVVQPFTKVSATRAIPKVSTDVVVMVFTVISIGLNAMPL